ncbi:hypothetical protein JKP88DRAFT_223316 [Tribonema minus]|uniref:SHSP domain-containing protein n=1 Tax=Tribonema minus TaxID=303371 RepID=A0A835YZU5_9STRA|nr:hypothetical protein JKP88DRAFT_223316 [Tribonema minus]
MAPLRLTALCMAVLIATQSLVLASHPARQRWQSRRGGCSGSSCFNRAMSHQHAAITQASKAFEAFFGEALSQNEAVTTAATPAAARPHRQPDYEITELPGSYLINIELPGCSTDDVNITLEEGGEILRIDGQRPARGQQPAGPQFSRRFELNKDIDVSRTGPSGISASMVHGVLTVFLPKVRKSEAVKIPIERAETAIASTIDEDRDDVPRGEAETDSEFTTAD